MANSFAGFNLNEAESKDDDRNVEFELNDPKCDDSDVGFDLNDPKDDDSAAKFDLNVTPMKDQNNNVNGHSFYDIHNSHAVCSFFDNI